MRAIVPAATLLLLSCALAGCGLLVGAGGDPPRRDAGSPDAATFDGRSTTVDGGVAIDGDVATDSAVSTCTSSECTLECSPLMTLTPGGGLGISEILWVGFRFEVPADAVAIRRAGLTLLNNSDAEEVLFVAVVALTGPTDGPDDPRLTSGDVLGSGTFTVAPRVSTASTALDIPVTPGWYAAVFGAGAFGAPAPVEPGLATFYQAGPGTCANGTPPFTLHQMYPSLLEQDGTPHLFVEVAPAP